MAVEVVILAPIIVVFMLLMIALGRVVEARGQVMSAARAASRAASVQRSASEALDAAQQAAASNLQGRCMGPPVVTDSGIFAEGNLVTYKVTCTIDLSGLQIIGFTPTKTITAEATTPLDTYRRID